MKYGKEFEKLIESNNFPPEWRSRAIEYKSLKKLLNEVVQELNRLGLPPDVLVNLLENVEEDDKVLKDHEEWENLLKPSSSNIKNPNVDVDDDSPHAQYVLEGPINEPKPQLRLQFDDYKTKSQWLKKSNSNEMSPNQSSAEDNVDDENNPDDDNNQYDDTNQDEVSIKYLYSLQKSSKGLESIDNNQDVNQDLIKQEQDNVDNNDDYVEEISTPGITEQPSTSDNKFEDKNNNNSANESREEVYINLSADAKFLGALTSAFDDLESLQIEQKKKFAKSVEDLCREITKVAGPGAVTHSAFGKDKTRTNDLYVWREIFTLWVESSIYEGRSERNRGERDVESAEKRLHAFAAEVVKRGLGDSRHFKSKQSRKALDRFLELNMALLDIKKFYTANLEAARKILKKHRKMTALPTATFLAFAGGGNSGKRLQSATSKSNSNFGWTFYTISLPRVLLARLTETLIPVIPSIDDYNCLICQEIAFKPIRLNCGHIFCVRCLVKMQKRAQGDCPLCRAPVVLSANRSEYIHDFN